MSSKVQLDTCLSLLIVKKEKSHELTTKEKKF